MYEKITSDNVIMFAIKNYNNPQCDNELEFHDDLKRFKYIKRLFKNIKTRNESPRTPAYQSLHSFK